MKSNQFGRWWLISMKHQQTFEYEHPLAVHSSGSHTRSLLSHFFLHRTSGQMKFIVIFHLAQRLGVNLLLKWFDFFFVDTNGFPINLTYWTMRTASEKWSLYASPQWYLLLDWISSNIVYFEFESHFFALPLSSCLDMSRHLRAYKMRRPKWFSSHSLNLIFTFTSLPSP